MSCICSFFLNCISKENREPVRAIQPPIVNIQVINNLTVVNSAPLPAPLSNSVEVISPKNVSKNLISASFKISAANTDNISSEQENIELPGYNTIAKPEPSPEVVHSGVVYIPSIELTPQIQTENIFQPVQNPIDHPLTILKALQEINTTGKLSKIDPASLPKLPGEEHS